MTIPQQLLTVFLILVSLPLVITLLAKIRLLPLALYFVATELFFPKWSDSHQTVCLILLAVCILYFVLMWVLRIRAWKQEQRYYEAQLLSRATPLFTIEDIENNN